jgi:predicted CXXCH cytochrome family protein
MSRPRKILVVCLLAAFLAGPGTARLARAAGINKKHDFGCARCHSTHQARGKRLWVQSPPSQTKTGTPLFGSDAICYSCHAAQTQTSSHMFEAGFSHPTGIPVKRAQVSPQLPVARVKGLGDVITCTSCHDPHIKTEHMLRIPAAGDQLCLACHRFE